MKYICGLLIAVAVVTAHGQSTPATLVLRNGQVVTVDAAMPEAQAIAITGDRITAVGSNDAIQKYVGPNTQVIDLAGRLAIPGLVESHGHFMGFGQSKLTLDLMDVKDWNVAIASPAETVTSTGGIRISAQQPLEFANDADAVLFGGSPRSRQIAEDRAIMSRLELDPKRQLIGSQCAGAWFLAKLGLLENRHVCTSLASRAGIAALSARHHNMPTIAAHA